MVAGVISVVVVVTIVISTAMFMRNKKSNRILPARRIIRKRPRDRKPWAFRLPFSRRDDPADKFLAGDPENDIENANHNNNIHQLPPPPPSAPALPPPPLYQYMPGERQWAIPTVSGAVVSKATRKSIRSKEASINSALVSELKMRLEQKKKESHTNRC
ncbi:hypothetical protein AAFF_G00139340 [Aldrovandia affinis]|uniref:Uncharacterized protein n=1 Tax=Aldrovandia affinis TaxID=143900 RepID=A0AAD7TC75_9TELE|nr:hypothetical protein AAFF_G00139340 [Aldrovandia affinis]